MLQFPLMKLWKYTIVYELLTVLLHTPRGESCRRIFFFKGCHLASCLKHFGPLAVGVFECYSVFNTLLLIFLKSKNMKLRFLK